MIKPLLFLLVLFPLIQSGATHAQEIPGKREAVIYNPQDSVLAQDILSRFSSRKEMPTAQLTAEIGKAFLGKPYVGQTLENGAAERLVVNLRELDCTTFAENCLALARTVCAPNPGFEQFIKELEKIRYRQGTRKGYPSRLHYFSDWIHDNGQKGLITEPANAFGSSLQVQVNFMSSHPDSYPVLKDHPELVPVLAGQEKIISNRRYFFLKKEDVCLNEDNLNEGDIVGLTTTITGLDVAHVGILVKKDERIHLLHASSAQKKVVISEEPLSELLMNKKSYTGILIARPK